jgi:hypothetical protein
MGSFEEIPSSKKRTKELKTDFSRPDPHDSFQKSLKDMLRTIGQRFILPALLMARSNTALPR